MLLMILVNTEQPQAIHIVGMDDVNGYRYSFLSQWGPLEL